VADCIRCGSRGVCCNSDIVMNQQRFGVCIGLGEIRNGLNLKQSEVFCWMQYLIYWRVKSECRDM